MSEIQFSDNYNDLSTDTGFQFEFHCEHCGETWRSEFDRYATGTAENLLGAAEGMFGGIFGTARNALGHVRSAGWSKARDKALREAVEQAKQNFHRCPRCANHFCDNCWNEDEGTCISCVPRLDPELAAINREAKIARAREVAYATAEVSKEDILDHLKNHVAKWWLPDEILFVDTLPHTATGKLLKTALREQYRDYAFEAA
jgi:hypothetical protein